MKKVYTNLVSLLFLSFFIISCSKDNIPEKPQYTILTKERIAALEAAADSVFMTVNAPGMIALVSVEGEKDYLIKRGVSNIATGELMNEKNYFRIASNTKTFTGTAVLILVDEGKINLDSSISYYLPEKNIPNGNRITIRMLGNMTSGLFNYTDDEELMSCYYQSNCIVTFPPDSLLGYSFRHPVNSPPERFMNTVIQTLFCLDY